MSLWDYKCGACGHVEEDIIEPYTETPEPRVCPRCSGSMVRVDLYQTWFSLQGTGWSYSPSNCNNFKVVV